MSTDAPAKGLHAFVKNPLVPFSSCQVCLGPESDPVHLTPPEATMENKGHTGVVPRALYEALGNLVSECADQRDIYPDAATALEAITATVNEIYGCVEDGVFGCVEPALSRATEGGE